MEKGFSNGEPPEEYKGPSWTTLRINYWKNQASDPNSQWCEDEDAAEGRAPTKKGQKIELHHPVGRKGNNIINFREMPRKEHRDFHKRNGFRYDEERGWH